MKHKRAVDQTGDRTIGLAWGVSVNGGGAQGRGSTSNLKSLATDLVARLRNNPDAPFEYPFDDRWQ